MKNRIRMVLPILVTLAMVLSMFGMATPVMAYALEISKVELIEMGDPAHPVGVYLVGMEVHYDLYIENTHGSDDAVFAANDIVDIEPGGSPTVPLNPTEVTLVPGGSWTMVYDYTIEAGDVELHATQIYVVVNTFEATGDQGIEHFTASGTQTVQVVYPDISVTKEVTPDVSKAGDEVTYTICIENTGDWPLENITVVDTILGDLSGSFADTLAAGDSECHDFS